MHEFRFSFNLGVESRATFVEACRRGEEYGYDLVLAPDHLGGSAPFPLLVAAAEVTERLRVGTLVLNSGFWNPALLAREVVTTDILTDGRLELGLGSGHMKWEFDEAGIDWEPAGSRAERLSATIADLGRFFTDGYSHAPEGRQPPMPVQRGGFRGSGPPLIVGGTGDRVLQIAACHADTIGVAGVYQIPGQPLGTFRVGTAAEADERVRFARGQAGDREDQVEWQVLVQMVLETEDRRAAATQLVERLGGTMTVEEMLETPFVLIGTAEQMVEQVLRSRERYGFTHVTVHGAYMAAFAPVLRRLRE